MSNTINPNLPPTALNQPGTTNTKEPADMPDLSPEEANSTLKAFQEQMGLNEKTDTSNLPPDLQEQLEQDPQLRSEMVSFQQLSPEQQKALLDQQSQAPAKENNDALLAAVSQSSKPKVGF